MNPSPEAIDAIRAHVTDWTPDDATIAASLNAPSITNPATQGTVNVPFAAVSIVNIVSAPNLLKIVALPSWDSTIVPLADAPEPKPASVLRMLNQWTAGAFKIGYLSQAEYDALVAPGSHTPSDSVMPGTTPGAPAGLYNATQPDPSWPPQLSWAVANLGRPVDATDVEAARGA